VAQLSDELPRRRGDDQRWTLRGVKALPRQDRPHRRCLVYAAPVRVGASYLCFFRRWRATLSQTFGRWVLEEPHSHTANRSPQFAFLVRLCLRRPRRRTVTLKTASVLRRASVPTVGVLLPLPCRCRHGGVVSEGYRHFLRSSVSPCFAPKESHVSCLTAA